MTTEAVIEAQHLGLPTHTLDFTLLQGHWTEEQYLLLSNQTNQIIEFTDGYFEVQPMPTKHHQALSRWLFLALVAFVQRYGGDVYYAPLRVQIRPGKYREPDVLLVRDATDPRAQDAYWLGADLVVEIVSPDRPERDTEEKVRDYAEAGIPEYWIVNPLDVTITVLTLHDAAYATHGVFGRDQQATSLLLSGFGVAVSDVFAAK